MMRCFPPYSLGGCWDPAVTREHLLNTVVAQTVIYLMKSGVSNVQTKMRKEKFNNLSQSEYHLKYPIRRTVNQSANYCTTQLHTLIRLLDDWQQVCQEDHTSGI